MEIVAIVLAAILAVLCVVFVARPFLRETGAGDEVARPAGAELERLRLAEARDRALAALRELEFDHRTGKIDDAEYRKQIGLVRRQAADAIRALEAVGVPGDETGGAG